MNTLTALQNAIDYFEENIHRSVSIEDMAKEANMSVFHFQRLFSMFFDISIGEYRRNRLLSLAGKEVLETQARIIDIALRMGHENPESFSRAFYRYFGVTPSAARSRKSQLKYFPRLSVNSILTGDNRMTDLTKRGYVVKENAAIYYSENLDETVQWFKDILGWDGGIDFRDDKGVAQYGSILPIPGDLVHMKIASFNGLHLFKGEPVKRPLSFLNIDDIEKFHSYVKKNGWEEISDIKKQPWGARQCEVTTIDGTVLLFFELD